MSARKKTSQAEKEVQRLRSELEDLKNSARAADVAEISAGATHSHEFDQLSPVEQSAASLGVNPASFKPISFLNNAHYAQLIKANMLDDNLARRIEVCESALHTSSELRTLIPIVVCFHRPTARLPLTRRRRSAFAWRSGLDWEGCTLVVNSGKREICV